MTSTIHLGDCRDIIATLDDNSIDAIVTDPPYELGFMGKKWDASGIAYNIELWQQALRVLKPGGHLLAFGGTRTYHRMAVAIEDAGFEIRDSIHWLYGSGFPKSLDVSKAIDKAAGAERLATGPTRRGAQSVATHAYGVWGDGITPTAPATDAARQWKGWGTALKPAHEPIVVARKPLVGTVAANVLAHGTGALNIDGTRVGSDTSRGDRYAGKAPGGSHGENLTGGARNLPWNVPAGRWPANLVLTHAAECGETCGEGCPVAELDEQSEGASRFFTVTEWDPIADTVPFRYIAKPSKRERNADNEIDNKHPTVKPVALMRWLVRLVTPPGGTVLDPFTGSGTTAVAAILESFDFIGCELTEDYLPIIDGRIAWAQQQTEPDQESLFNQ